MYSLIGLAAVLTLSSRVAADCYFPNGNVSGLDTVCNPTALVSACCFSNQACMSNGLCMSDPHDSTKARLHRGTCSDKSWQSSACPRECLGLADDGANVYSCNVTNVDSYCCFDDCKCNDSKFETFNASDTTDVYALTIIGESFTQTHTSSSTSATQSASITSSGTAASTTGASSSSSPPASAAASSSSSNSTAIGVGVGVSVGALLLIGAAIFFFWRRKKRNNDKNTGNPYVGGAAPGGPYGDTKHLAEMDNSEAAPQYYPPSHSQKYAYHASENPSPSNAQRTSSSNRHINSEPVELSSANTWEPVELPTSPPPVPSKERKMAF